MIITGAIIGIILVLIGIVGCIIPALPGVQLAYIGLIISHFMMGKAFSVTFLTIRFLITVITMIVDQILPTLATKKFGGSKYGTYGSLLGTIIGLFGGIIGIIIGPFLGARIGEFIKEKKIIKTLKPALGSLFGIAMSGIIKIAICVIIGYEIIIKAINIT